MHDQEMKLNLFDSHTLIIGVWSEYNNPDEDRWDICEMVLCDTNGKRIAYSGMLNTTHSEFGTLVAEFLAENLQY